MYIGGHEDGEFKTGVSDTSGRGSFFFVVVFSSLYFRFRILTGDFCINRRCAPTLFGALPLFKLERDIDIG